MERVCREMLGAGGPADGEEHFWLADRHDMTKGNPHWIALPLRIEAAMDVAPNRIRNKKTPAGLAPAFRHVWGAFSEYDH